MGLFCEFRKFGVEIYLLFCVEIYMLSGVEIYLLFCVEIYMLSGVEIYLLFCVEIYLLFDVLILFSGRIYLVEENI
jgi:hypothetical protein